MRNVVIKRFESSDFGTLGRLFIDGQLFCWSMEPPERNNLRNKSCIPAGKFHCVWRKSPRYGWVYLISHVPGRGHILIHSGNLGGDISKGFKTHTKGCLLLGKRAGWLGKQRAVLVSRSTVFKFFKRLGKQGFLLTIDEVL